MNIDLKQIDTIYLSKRQLNFSFPAGTSRGVMRSKDSYFLNLVSVDGNIGVGECSIIKGLSIDDVENYLHELLLFIEEYKSIENIYSTYQKFPSIIFGIESAWLDMIHGGKQILFPSHFTESKSKIPINGLIWMGSEDFMWKQVVDKVENGYNCIKIKIGAINWTTELGLIQRIRNEFDSGIILRVDANGAFDYPRGLEVCAALKKYNIHSIEQPISTKSLYEYAQFCKESLVPVALDEQLIGVFDKEEKRRLLQEIQPSYIVLKPSLHGGFEGCNEWILLAKEFKIAWWITSALESNIGLNAIAQWTATLDTELHHGLGTGKIYTNNTDSLLSESQGFLSFIN